VTFCIGIKVREGVVALADSRIVVGNEQTKKHKLAPFEYGDGAVFTMTSGLRAVRDKTLAYLSEALKQTAEPCDRVFKLANAYGQQLRIVRSEDESSLNAAGLTFNSHAIIGGRLNGDATPQLFYIYPQGNWVESTPDLPYFIIGRSSYGKPILDRLLHYETPIHLAVALALLAFDSTKTSVTDVDAPIDVAVVPNDSLTMTIHRFEDEDIAESTKWWKASLQSSLQAMPKSWIDRLLPNSTT
jgi:putative proteasome-type protease